ncbi:prepilin-type N-terminal cleavage/methylation domain-containing protein [Deltaproteobacteria bacterium]|nr:prepilin-type N-terminal cleavage/methylation domain-containing protein [Deltaproteobacteria bacterium]
MMIRKYRHKSLKNEIGFTLVEVMVALGILSFGVLAVASMQTSSLLGTARSNAVTMATTTAMDRMERLMALPFDTLATLSNGDNSYFSDAPALPANIVSDDKVLWTVAAGPPPVQANTRIITVSVQSKETTTPVILINVRITD